MENLPPLFDFLLDNPAVAFAALGGAAVLAFGYAALFGWCAGGVIADWRAKKPFRFRQIAQAILIPILAYGSWNGGESFNFLWAIMAAFAAMFYFRRNAQHTRRDKTKAAEEWLARQDKNAAKPEDAAAMR